MKALKTFGIILGSIIGLVLVVGLVAPKEMSVARSVQIDAPPSTVYSYVSTFEQSSRWQPWDKRDPNMKQGIDGMDGEVGSSNWWEGNEEVGKGKQTLMSVTPNERVEVEMHFIEPFESKAAAFTQLEEVDGGTKVTWGFDSPMAFPMNVMGLFMTGALEDDYDEGLASLKQLVESEQQITSK
ncbi:MAG: SRPBCC family protein [Bacteroidota bacterium]